MTEPTIEDGLVAIAHRDVDAIAGSVPRLLAGPERARFLDLLLAHRLQGLLWAESHLLDESDVEMATWLDALTAQRTATQLTALGQLRDWGSLLESIACPYIVLKGPVLAQRAYADPALRPYGDLDLLVPADRFLDAVRMLEGSGAELLDQNWDLLRREERSQLHLDGRLGMTTDLHWHLLNRGSVRRAFEIAMGGVFARSREVDVGGFTAPALDAIDELLHLGLHAALAGGRRLLWSVDIAVVTADEPPDWDHVVQRALGWKAGTITGISLDRARREAGAAVPEDVLAELYRLPQSRRIADRLDRRWPAAAGDATRDPAGFAGEVARDRWLDVVRIVGVRLRRRLGRSKDSPYERAGNRGSYESWLAASF